MATTETPIPSNTNNGEKKPFRIAVVCEGIQSSDIVGVDMLGNLSRPYVDAVSSLLDFPPSVQQHAIDNMEILFLGSALGTPSFMTPGIRYLPTATYETCPRDLDMVFVGGSSPDASGVSEEAKRFVREAWTKTRVWLTTCSGSMWLANMGVLEGRKCTTNREFLGLAGKMHPAVEWLDQRWVVDEKPFDGEGEDGKKGELWTGGGAGAGEFFPVAIMMCLFPGGSMVGRMHFISY